MSDFNSKEIVVYLLGVVGSLLLLGGCLIAYIFKRHVSENDKHIEQNYNEHVRIFEKIERIS